MNTPTEGNKRQAYLEFLYDLDGRHYPKHPAHGTYTGLYQERMRQLAQAESDLLATGRCTVVRPVADDVD